VHEDRHLFEMLILEGAQAGLSWLTVLRKRENYRKTFAGFDASRIAQYGPREVNRLLADPGIIRNRLKVAATIANARAFLEVRERFGTFDTWIWRFVDHQARQNRWRRLGDLPARTPDSDRMSKELRAAGFRFVGSTICYAFMQAVGMVNDHLVTCPRHREVARIGRSLDAKGGRVGNCPPERKPSALRG
jgi:DNA-3-methyladenine glycosylase I